jgi:anti-anti-sigma factor
MPEGKPIMVDLANVSLADSVGIGTFVSVWASARKSGCELKFINLNEQIHDLFEITRLHGLFGTDVPRT